MFDSLFIFDLCPWNCPCAFLLSSSKRITVTFLCCAHFDIFLFHFDQVCCPCCAQVWCDMTTDNAAGYTYYRCTNCTSVNTVNQPNGCHAVGLEMVIPRTQAMWESMFAFLKDQSGDPEYLSYFEVVPGIYKNTSGYYPSCRDPQGGRGIMNYDSCSGLSGGWQALDGGRWWLRDTADVFEPSGDYYANCFLGNFVALFFIKGLIQIRYNDQDCLYFTVSRYLRSTNDGANHLPPPTPPPIPPVPPVPPQPPSIGTSCRDILYRNLSSINGWHYISTNLSSSLRVGSLTLL